MHFFDWDLIKENKTCYPSLACSGVCQEWEQIIYSLILIKNICVKAIYKYISLNIINKKYF